MVKENSTETIRHLENMTWYEKLDESDLFGREEKTGSFLLLEIFFFPKTVPDFLWSL